MKKHTLLFLLINFSLFLAKPLFAQELKYFGSPFITQYLPKDYDGSAQNWAITQDARGLMYVGNTGGLLEFDGVNWRKYAVSNSSVIRSIAIDSTGNIWVGASDEFGWFAPDSLGDLTYHSLAEKLPDSIQNFADIWQTVVAPTGVYFFSRRKLFQWHKGKLTVTNTGVQASFSHKASNQLFVWSRDRTKALCLLQDTTLTPLLSDEDILRIGVGFKGISEYQDGKLLICTGGNGFFIYDIKSKTISQPELDPKITAYFTQNRAYSMCKINDDSYAVGTIKGGILVFNAKFELIDVVNTMRGLQSNSVYILFTDQNEDLWSGHPNGLARIELSNPLRAFGEKQNMNSFGIDAVNFEGEKYVGTMNGCYVLDKHELSIKDDNQKFSNIPNINSCWELEIHQNKLLIGGNNGLSQIVNRSAKQIFDLERKSVFSMITSKRFPNHVFVGYQDAFVAVELVKQGNSEYLAVKDTIHFPNIVGEVRTITQDENGNVWLGKASNGAVFIQFAGDSDISDYEIHYLDEKNDLPSDGRVEVVTFNDKLTFVTGKGIYKQVDETQAISTETRFERDVFWKSNSKYDSIRYKEFFKLADNSYIITGDLNAFLRKENDSLVINRVPFTKINKDLANLLIEENYINVCAISSFYTYSLTKDSLRTDRPYNALIRKVAIGQDSLIFNGSYYKNEGEDLVLTQTQGENQTPTLDYTDNSIKFYFSATFYDTFEELEYSYVLEGFNEKWSAWSKETRATFTNVPEGEYTFKVKAKNFYGVESTIATYQFEVLAPWYRTFFAYAGYLLLLAGFMWLVVRLNSQRLIKEKIKLENIVIERTAELHQQNEEVMVQAESLIEANNKLEESYTNVQLLSEIGQKITKKLSVEDIIDTVYEHVNQLMDAEVFAIGVVSTDETKIDFYGTRESEQTLPYYFDELDNNNKLSVYCYKNFETIMLKDYDVEIKKYLIQPGETTAGESTNSLIYLPLGTVEKKIGVITAQSFSQNAYTAYHLNILRNIAIYTEIALENASAYQQISKQRDEITNQHHHIKSSVSYASTIQNAILPSQKHLDRLFDNFIIYRPKDIVSGDFYWLSEIENKIFVAAVDCTGHGVPGAFMSMIGSRLLSEIVNEKKIWETDVILEALNTGVRKALRQEQTDNTDGMDICLCKIEKNDLGAEISFTGAKSPLFIYQNDKADLLRIRGDKKAIGGHHFQTLSFTQSKVSLKKGDTIYLTTDGFVDQNNKERKKITTLGLMTLLKKGHDKPLATQKEFLETELGTWQGKEYQRDDITILGIKI
jgi:serine phosphatase RsbU (regulator of sigma subunit)/ligand-binding sensor domain-containing protein